VRELRFLDSSVFLHAYLKPRRALRPEEKRVKESAKSLLTRVDKGKDKVLISVVHLSEILNIVESRLGLKESIGLLSRILSLQNIIIVGVNKEDYEKAIAIASHYNVSVNDAIAYIKMKEFNLNEIYTFDKHFKNLPGTKIVQK